MSNISPEILELAKREYGENCELVQATEWSYTFKCGTKSYCRISRFMAEKDFEVAAEDIRERWPQWDERQRMDFASNWWNKKTWTANDTEILEIIMADGDDHIWQSCTQAFLKHSDRSRAVSFLVDRVLHYTLEHEPLNYFQVLGMAKDERAVPAILPFYEKYKRVVDTEAALGVQEDVFRGPIPYFPYLVAAGALFKITGKPEYELSIRKFFNHEKEQVRYWAERELEVEGPTTTKRNAEYRESDSHKRESTLVGDKSPLHSKPLLTGSMSVIACLHHQPKSDYGFEKPRIPRR